MAHAWFPRDPRVALSALSNDPARHLALPGVVVDTRADPHLQDIDILSQHDRGRRWHERGSTGITTVVVEVRTWISFGFDEVDGGLWSGRARA